jgi:hypothetical protein
VRGTQNNPPIIFMPPKTRSSSSVLQQAGKVASDLFGLKSPNTSSSPSHTSRFSSAKSESEWGEDELNLSQEDIENLNNMGDNDKDNRKRQASVSPTGGTHRQQDMEMLTEIRSLRMELNLLKTWQDVHGEIIKTNVSAVNNAVSLVKDTQEQLSQFMTDVAGENEHLRETIRQLEENFQKLETAGVHKITEDAKQTLTQLENIQASIKDQMERRTLSATTPGGGTPSELGVYIVGLTKYRSSSNLSPNMDPAEVVKHMLEYARCKYGLDRIVVITPKDKTRKDANSAIVYFTNLYHRRDSVALMKKMLAYHKTSGIGLRDLFPTEKLMEVRELTQIGIAMKNAKKVDRFRVVNIKDKPVLQGGAGREGFSDIDVEANRHLLEARNTAPPQQQRQQKKKTNNTLVPAGSDNIDDMEMTTENEEELFSLGPSGNSRLVKTTRTYAELVAEKQNAAPSFK